MSLEETQSCLISASDNWTCLPGLADRTSVSRLIMSSTTAGSIVTCPCAAIGFLDPPLPPPPLQRPRLRENLEMREKLKELKKKRVGWYFWFYWSLFVKLFFFFLSSIFSVNLYKKNYYFFFLGKEEWEKRGNDIRFFFFSFLFPAFERQSRKCQKH